jgi:arylsulfatase A-like enzyme
VGAADPQAAFENKSRWIAASRYAVAWIVPAIFCILVKFLILGNGRGFRVVARFLGRSEGPGDPGLSIAERLTFFRSEILWLDIVVPVLLILMLRILNRPLRIVVTAVVSVLASVLIFVQARSLEEMGDFVSFAMLRIGLTWGIHDPGANKAYLLGREFYLLIAGFLVIGGIIFWAARAESRATMSARGHEMWRQAGLTYFAAMAFLGLAAWRPVMARTPFHANILARSISSLWATETMDTREFEGLPISALADRYREMVSAPAPSVDSRYFGAMRGGNLIIFVLETTPERFLPSSDSLDEFPTLKRLEANSFIAEQHFTTYPYTNPALFSVFASCYPSDGTSSFGEQHPDVKVPGLVAALEDSGYQTGIYLPSALHGDADRMTFRSFGFDHAVTPDAAQLRPFWPGDLSPDWKAERVARDRAVLTLAKFDIDRWLTGQQSFAIAIAPQIAHLPWPDKLPDDTAVDIRTRGRAILAIEDAWLGELVHVLEAHHQLENTIIAVFGDHGIRTRHEDPNFVGGTLDEYSFHVPLRIYAARALASPVRVSSLTSHIDIAPTLLDLLGVQRSRDLEEGAPIWDSGIANRTTFFLARQAFGADGYRASDRFYMWNQISDTVSVSERAHFETHNVLLRDSSESREVIGRIRRMVAFGQVWLEKLAETKSGSRERAN